MEDISSNLLSLKSTIAFSGLFKILIIIVNVLVEPQKSRPDISYYFNHLICIFFKQIRFALSQANTNAAIITPLKTVKNYKY